MEKPSINFSFKDLIARFRTGGEEGMGPDMLWRIVLGGTFIGICVIGVFAYLTYGWATSVEIPAKAPPKTRDTFSLTELEGVIAAYQNKEVLSKQLLQSPPVAPQYRKGSGPVATSSSSVPDPVPVVEPPGSLTPFPGHGSSQ